MIESFPKAGAGGGGGVGDAKVLLWSQVSQGLSVQLPGFSEVSLSVPKGLGLAISVSTNFTFIFMDSFLNFVLGVRVPWLPCGAQRPACWSRFSSCLCSSGERAQVARISCQAPFLAQPFH